MNGFEVCRTLRSEGNATPILVLTAKDGEYDEAEALDTGADDFLSKPFSFVVLVARLRALLRRVRSTDAGEFGVGSLRLDVRRRRCWRGDDEIKLTPREFALLERLMRTPGEVCSKDELLAEVWGPDSVRDANVVEVYVRYVRRKIDVPFGTSTLETVRGAGYRVVTGDA
jgi:DNA-binding response OmpR family regulator